MPSTVCKVAFVPQLVDLGQQNIAEDIHFAQEGDLLMITFVERHRQTTGDRANSLGQRFQRSREAYDDDTASTELCAQSIDFFLSNSERDIPHLSMRQLERSSFELTART